MFNTLNRLMRLGRVVILMVLLTSVLFLVMLSQPQTVNPVDAASNVPQIITSTLSTQGDDYVIDLYFEPFFGLRSISCPTTTTCYGPNGRYINMTKDGGATWTEVLDITETENVYEISFIDCPTEINCVGAGEVPIITKNGGQNWYYSPNYSSQAGGSVSCPTSQTCFMVGYFSIEKSTDGGDTWSTTLDTYDPPSGSGPFPGSINCPIEATCYAIAVSMNGRLVLITKNGGQNWVSNDLSDQFSALDQIECPTAETCFILSNEGKIITTKNGGASWSQTDISDHALHDISCPARNICFIAGEGAILVTHNRGSSWQLISEGEYYFETIDCPTPENCMGSGFQGDNFDSFSFSLKARGISVSKSSNPSSVVVSGGTLNYTITAVNNEETAVSATITDSLPNQVTPNGTLEWGPIDLAPGETWTQAVAVTVNPGYTGILENVVQATTTTGKSDTYTNTVEVVDATIQSVKSGSWNRADTWNLNRVPNENDVALISSNHTVSVRGATVRGVYNYGNLSSSSASDINLSATEAISNYGQISGGTGSPGSHITLNADTVYNEGTIQAGNGRDEGNFSKGDGGDVRIYGRKTINHGTILAGRGGNDVNSPILQAGRGGDIKITGGSLSNPGTLLNDGLIRAGDGGDFVGTPSFTSVSAGRGGSVTLLSPDLRLDNGQIYAGRGGNGNGAKDGRDGQINLEPNTIAISGNDTKLEGGNVIIFGGDDWVLDLSNLSAGAIQATDSITLAVGTNGVVDLQNNSSAILQAGNRIFIAADDVRLDAGTDLADVTQAGNVETGPNQILYDVSLTGPGQITGQPGQATSLELDVLNGGPLQDRYDVSWTDAAGWSVSGLPASITVAGLEVGTLTLDVIPPADTVSEATNVLTVTAVSQADPATEAVVTIQLSVGHQVYLPTVLK